MDLSSFIAAHSQLLLFIAIGTIAVNVLVLLIVLIVLCRRQKKEYTIPTQCVTRKAPRYFPSAGHTQSMASDFTHLI